MAGIPVKDLGVMAGTVFPGSAGTPPAKQPEGASSFGEIWNGQMERSVQKSDLSSLGKRPEDATAARTPERKRPEQTEEKPADPAGKVQGEKPVEKPSGTETAARPQGEATEGQPAEETEKLEEAMEVLGTAAMELMTQIADHFQIAPEEVQADMEELGLQPAELLQGDSLSRLLLKVGDAQDVTSLLTNEELYQDYSAVMAGQEELLQGVEETLEAMDVEVPVEELIAQTIEADVPQTVQPGQPEGATVEVEVAEESDRQTEEEPSAIRPEELAFAEKAEENPVERSNAGRPESGGEHRERREQADHRQITPSYQTVQTQEFQVQAESTVTETTSAWDPDTQNIMRQIMDYMRVQIRPDMSNLQMQLHPASLGSLQIQVAAKGGVVTAQFFTQNETVKAVLESQMIQLKESFAEQGVKVEAIEVSVQTHEFERSMDQGENKQSGQEPSRRSRTRRIDLNGANAPDLENLEEDERLAAEMMAANGNSVDYTA